jgi:hypothetical protein
MINNDAGDLDFALKLIRNKIERLSRLLQLQGRCRSAIVYYAFPSLASNTADAVRSASPTCWVVAESEAQRVSNFKNKKDRIH